MGLHAVTPLNEMNPRTPWTQTPEVSLAALGVNFSLDDVIVKGLIKEKI